MQTGTVKFFNAVKGFGFITPDENTKDVFVPTTSLTAAGFTSLKAGQRVSFKAMPDTKGPKAVDLKIIAPVETARAPKQDPAAPAAREEPNKLTVYIDPDSASADEVLAELRHAGHEPVVVDYIASPPTKDALKNLSLLLRESNQSLVRKYEPLFLELRLDDRFISDGEYWEAIFEHPSLINGPVVATPVRASICHSKSAVKSFLSAAGQPVAKPKGLPPGLLRLVDGAPAMPPAVTEIAAAIPQSKTKDVAVKKIQIAAQVKTAAKPQAKGEKAKPKSAAKAKAPTKKPVRTPAKKPVRKAKK
jgi:cold shock CspA family protein/arsenate reductase-like glutaredoxin family protein